MARASGAPAPALSSPTFDVTVAFPEAGVLRAATVNGDWPPRRRRGASQSRVGSSRRERQIQRLPDHAMSLLNGARHPSIDEEIAQLRAIEVAEVHQVAVEAVRSILLRVPAGRSADWAGYTAVPRHSRYAIEGTRFTSLSDPDVQLAIGPDGCGLLTSEGPISVRFAECAALLAWPDGGRQIVGRDGTAVALEPTLFKGLTPETLAYIDATVGPNRTLHRPERHPDEIPRPAAVSTPRVEPSPEGKRAMRVHLVIASIFGVFGLLAAIGLLIDPTADFHGWVGVGCIWLVSGLLAFLGLKRRKDA